MQISQNPIPLNPWITQAKSLHYKYHISKQSPHQKSIIIAIINVKPQKLSLFGNITLSENQAVAYISPPFSMNSILHQIAYLPYKEIKQCSITESVSDILKSISAFTITDASCGGLHRFREGKLIIGQAKQFVLVNSRDFYQIESKEGKLELAKKVDLFLRPELSMLPETDVKNNLISVCLIEEILGECLKEFSFFLNSERNWKTLVDWVLIKYKSQRQLQGKPLQQLPVQQLESLQKEILREWKEGKDYRAEFDQQLALRVLRTVFQSKISSLQSLVSIRQSFACKMAEDEQDFAQIYNQVLTILESNNIPSVFSEFVLHEHHLKKAAHENQMLKERISFLYQENMEREEKIACKNRKIDELKEMIGELAAKAQQMNKNTLKLIEITQLYQQEKQKNWKLSLELQSYAFRANKNAEFKIQMQTKTQSLIKERGELLFAMQQLTQENLSLMTERENLSEQVKDLKDRLEQIDVVEARALKSIQNQAEIKVRLSRYENYVKQLKQVLNCFKKAQIEKFNYILQRNYKEYQQLEEKHKCCQFELRRSQSKIKELQQNLHCQKIKVGYFQKIFVSQYQTDVIPQVSEESSATDRQLQQTA